MGKVIEFMEKNILPVAGKIGGQRHLIAIRDGFMIVLPLVMLGSLAVLLNNFPIEAYQKIMLSIFGEGWKSFGDNIWWATFALSSIFTITTVSYSLANSYTQGTGINAGVVALASFFTLVPQSLKNSDGIEIWGGTPWSYLSATGLFTGLLVAIIATEIFVRLSRNAKLTITLPDSVPPAVARSFAKLLPGMITIIIVALVGVIVSKISSGRFLNDIINEVFAKPLQTVADSFWSALLIPFLQQIFWFFGLHGSNILSPVLSVTLTPFLQANMEALKVGAPIPHILALPFFDAYTTFGGSGTTFGLLVAIFMVSKSKHHKTISELAIGPAFFNINEPVIFGMPMVLNPLFAIPFIFTQSILAGIAYLATASGLVHPIVANIPWTTPPIIGGYLATGGHISGAIMAAICLVISVVIYLPFVYVAGKQLTNVGE